MHSGELDILLFGLPYPSESVEFLELFTDRLPLVYRKDSIYKGFIQSDNLINLPEKSILLLEDGHCLKTHTLSTCHLFSNQQINDFSTNTLASIIEMVQYDMGINFIPDMAIKNGI